MRALLLATVALLVVVAPAAGYGVSVSASPNPVQRGHTTRLRGHVPPGQCRRLSVISQAFPRTHLADDEAAVPVTPSRRTGRFSVPVRIPAGRATGRYVMTMRCDGGALGVIASLRVKA